MTPTKQQFNFQKSFEELEALVEKFERGQIDLDQALREFEHGLELAEALKARLKEVENKVMRIKAKFGEEENESVKDDTSENQDD